jgi:chromosome segregation ATPase
MLHEKLARGFLTARVPADKLEQALAEFRKLGVMARLNTSGNDVSGALADYDARLNAARGEEAQLLDLLKQAKAVSDLIEIRGRLTNVRSEIESLQSQKGALQNQVDMASIQATLYEPNAAPEEVHPAGRVGQAWAKAADAAATMLAGFILAAGFLAPLVALGLLAWLIVWLTRRRRHAQG